MRGIHLLKRRMTMTPSMKNYKNLKYFYDIKNHYDFGKKLGEGAYGQVRVATKKTTKEIYACKAIRKASFVNDELPQLLISELNVL